MQRYYDNTDFETFREPGRYFSGLSGRGKMH